MWVMLLLFIPIAVGFRQQIYPWANQAWAGFHEIQEAKGKYLNPQLFFILVAVYFAFFLWAWRIRVLSLEFYATARRTPSSRAASGRPRGSSSWCWS